MILPDRTFFSCWIHDARLRRLNPQVQLLLIFLRPLCDRFGRFEVKPALIHMALYTSAECSNVSVRDVEAWLEILRSGGYIKTYTGADGRRIGEVHKDYWRQKLTFGKAIYESESGTEPLLDLAAPEPPPPPGPEMKRREKKFPQPPSPPATGESGSFSDSFSADPQSPAPAAPTPEPADLPDDWRTDLGYRTAAQIHDELFRTLAALEGSPLDKLTTPGRTALTRALNAIRRVERGLTTTDLERAAAAHKALWPTIGVSAASMARNWAKLQGPTAAAAKPKPLVEEEPLGWRDWINENTPGTKYARDGECEGTPWHDLPGEYRRYLLQNLTKSRAA